MTFKQAAVRKMQMYIQSHLNEPITLVNLSRACGYSPYHAARLFKELTGYSPYYYIKACRLTDAALELRDTDKKVIDVAFDHVFDSHEGFTRAFSKQFGLTPKNYSNTTPPIRYFLPYVINKETMRRVKMTQTIFTQVIERPLRQAIVKRGVKATEYFAYCEEVGCDVWGILASVKEALYEPIGMWLPANMIKPGTSEYVQGVEVSMDYDNEIPEGFELMTLPACKIMIFQGEAFEDEDFEAAIVEVMTAIKKYKPELYGFEFADELNPRFQLEPQGYRGYIEGRPVIEIKR